MKNFGLGNIRDKASECPWLKLVKDFDNGQQSPYIDNGQLFGRAGNWFRMCYGIGEIYQCKGMLTFMHMDINFKRFLEYKFLIWSSNPYETMLKC